MDEWLDGHMDECIMYGWMYGWIAMKICDTAIQKGEWMDERMDMMYVWIDGDYENL